MIACFPAVNELRAQTAEASLFTLLHTYSRPVDFFTTDQLGYLYLVHEGEVVKMDEQGQELFRFNDMLLGAPSLVDATNPMQLLVYYDEFQTVVRLDRTLTQTSSFDLWSLGLPTIPVVAIASDGRLWIYNEVQRKLQKIGAGGQVEVETPDLALIDTRALSPLALVERNNRLFLQSREGAVLVFDNFGGFVRTYEVDATPLPGLQVLEKTLLTFTPDELLLIDLTGPGRRRLELPGADKALRRASIQKERGYLLLEDRLEIYRLRAKK